MITGIVLAYRLDFRSSGGLGPSEDRALTLPKPSQVPSGSIKTVLPRDSIRSIDDPKFESIREAASSLEPGERVLGVEINGDARAYPIPILSAHEVVNDVVGGEPVAVTWCPLCYSALVFSRSVEGVAQPLSFGVSGKLLYNTLVMYDHQTESLWSQLYGYALTGPMSGRSLRVYPSTLTQWEVWVDLYPGGRILSKRLTCQQFDCGTYSDNPRGSYQVDPYASYYSTPDEGILDNQIPKGVASNESKERVLGLRLGTSVRAYPYGILKDRQVINDQLNETPVLIWFDPPSQTGRAYIRRVGDRTLTLELSESSGELLVDLETGSTWRAGTGAAVKGPLQGETLPELAATPAFEFGWMAYFPHSDVYPGE